MLVGYNGVNNTGAEAKLLACINEIRSVLGPDACITAPLAFSIYTGTIRRWTYSIHPSRITQQLRYEAN